MDESFLVADIEKDRIFQDLEVHRTLVFRLVRPSQQVPGLSNSADSVHGESKKIETLE